MACARRHDVPSAEPARCPTAGPARPAPYPDSPVMRRPLAPVPLVVTPVALAPRLIAFAPRLGALVRLARGLAPCLILLISRHVRQHRRLGLRRRRATMRTGGGVRIRRGFTHPTIVAGACI